MREGTEGTRTLWPSEVFQHIHPHSTLSAAWQCDQITQDGSHGSSQPSRQRLPALIRRDRHEAKGRKAVGPLASSQVKMGHWLLVFWWLVSFQKGRRTLRVAQKPHGSSQGQLRGWRVFTATRSQWTWDLGLQLQEVPVSLRIKEDHAGRPRGQSLRLEI